MKKNLLVHKHLIIRAEASKPPTDEEQLKEWMTRFIESINMKVFMGPYVKYCHMQGNRGITAVAIIETAVENGVNEQKTPTTGVGKPW